MQDPGDSHEERPLQPPSPERVTAGPALALAASTGLAIAALVLAAVKGAPYLDLSALNGWLALFAGAAFGALFSVPFAAERVLKEARPESAERWEPALMIWGGVAFAALLLGGLLIAAGGFAPADSLADAAGLLLVIEAGLVAATLAVWALSG
jgi:hypothetical protein